MNIKLNIFLFLTTVWKVELTSANLQKAFCDSEIVPDIIDTAPWNLASVTYPCGYEVNAGDYLTVDQSKDAPSVAWDANPHDFYTLIMIDPDAPSKKAQLLGEFEHWAVVNIPGNDLDRGEVLAAYVSPSPPPALGSHRYIFLVYQQCSRQQFNEIVDPSSLPSPLRSKFSVSDFAEKYDLRGPVAGNFFYVKGQLPKLNPNTLPFNKIKK